MKQEQASRIFVIGFMGSDRKSLAEKLAAELNYNVIDLDHEIEKKDGRTIQRICMMMGEHEYRNKEYEMLSKLSQDEKIVVICGDGILFDDMNREILLKNKVLVADPDTSVQILWERAKDEKGLPYAFMNQTNEAVKKEKFIELYQQRKPLYQQFTE